LRRGRLTPSILLECSVYSLEAPMLPGVHRRNVTLSRTACKLRAFGRLRTKKNSLYMPMRISHVGYSL
jgi:hypothetical protein